MENNEKEMTLLEIWSTIYRNIWFIIITTCIFLIISFIFAFFIQTPKYSSTGDIMVQVEQDTSSNLDPNFDLVNAFRLIDTIVELIEKDIVLENAVNRLELMGYKGLSVIYLREGLSVNSSSTSYFVNIQFIDKDVSLAVDAVDAVIDAAIEETDRENAFPVLDDKLRRTSYASDATYDSPNKVLYITVGILLGLIFSLGTVFIKEAFSMKFASKDEIEETLKMQILGIIPKMELKEKKNAKK